MSRLIALVVTLASMLVLASAAAEADQYYAASAYSIAQLTPSTAKQRQLPMAYPHDLFKFSVDQDNNRVLFVNSESNLIITATTSFNSVWRTTPGPLTAIAGVAVDPAQKLAYFAAYDAHYAMAIYAIDYEFKKEATIVKDLEALNARAPYNLVYDQGLKSFIWAGQSKWNMTSIRLVRSDLSSHGSQNVTLLTFQGTTTEIVFTTDSGSGLLYFAFINDKSISVMKTSDGSDRRVLKKPVFTDSDSMVAIAIEPNGKYLFLVRGAKVLQIDLAGGSVVTLIDGATVKKDAVWVITDIGFSPLANSVTVAVTEVLKGGVQRYNHLVTLQRGTGIILSDVSETNSSPIDVAIEDTKACNMYYNNGTCVISLKPSAGGRQDETVYATISPIAQTTSTISSLAVGSSGAVYWTEGPSGSRGVNGAAANVVMKSGPTAQPQVLVDNTGTDTANMIVDSKHGLVFTLSRDAIMTRWTMDMDPTTRVSFPVSGMDAIYGFGVSPKRQDIYMVAASKIMRLDYNGVVLGAVATITSPALICSPWHVDDDHDFLFLAMSPSTGVNTVGVADLADTTGSKAVQSLTKTKMQSVIGAIHTDFDTGSLWFSVHTYSDSRTPVGGVMWYANFNLTGRLIQITTALERVRVTPFDYLGPILYADKLYYANTIADTHIDPTASFLGSLKVDTSAPEAPNTPLDYDVFASHSQLFRGDPSVLQISAFDIDFKRKLVYYLYSASNSLCLNEYSMDTQSSRNLARYSSQREGGAVAVDFDGQIAYVLRWEGLTATDLTTQQTSTVIAPAQYGSQIAFDRKSGYLYFSDRSNMWGSDRVRRCLPAQCNDTVQIVVGEDIDRHIRGLALDVEGGRLYVLGVWRYSSTLADIVWVQAKLDGSNAVKTALPTPIADRTTWNVALDLDNKRALLCFGSSLFSMPVSNPTAFTVVMQAAPTQDFKWTGKSLLVAPGEQASPHAPRLYEVPKATATGVSVGGSSYQEFSGQPEFSTVSQFGIAADKSYIVYHDRQRSVIVKGSDTGAASTLFMTPALSPIALAVDEAEKWGYYTDRLLGKVMRVQLTAKTPRIEEVYWSGTRRYFEVLATTFDIGGVTVTGDDVYWTHPYSSAVMHVTVGGQPEQLAWIDRAASVALSSDKTKLLVASYNNYLYFIDLQTKTTTSILMQTLPKGNIHLMPSYFARNCWPSTMVSTKQLTSLPESQAEMKGAKVIVPVH